MGIKIFLIFSGLCLLVSCSHHLIDQTCIVTKSALVLGSTDVQLNSLQVNLDEYCQKTKNCQSLSVKSKGNEIILSYQKNNQSTQELLLGALATQQFQINRELIQKSQSNMHEFEELKNIIHFEIDYEAKVVKQKLDTNILFYNRNEAKYIFTNNCSIEQAIIGAIAIKFKENIPQ